MSTKKEPKAPHGYRELKSDEPRKAGDLIQAERFGVGPEVQRAFRRIKRAPPAPTVQPTDALREKLIELLREEYNGDSDTYVADRILAILPLADGAAGDADRRRLDWLAVNGNSLIREDIDAAMEATAPAREGEK